jgi:hypothetical protein
MRCLENVLTDYTINLLVALSTSEFWQSINKLTERLVSGPHIYQP